MKSVYRAYRKRKTQDRNTCGNEDGINGPKQHARHRVDQVDIWINFKPEYREICKYIYKT